MKQLLNGNDPQLDRRGQAHVTENDRSFSWEILPPEETSVGKSALEHVKARAILNAFIGGATKSEIARVFGLKQKLIHAVIAAAQQYKPHERHQSN